MTSLSRATLIKIRCIGRVCGNMLNDHRLMLSTAKLVETEENRKLKNLSRVDYSIMERVTGKLAPTRTSMIESLDIQIKDRKHHVTFSAEDVVKWLRFGVLDPNVATQYCFFLTEFCNSCNDQDRKYFGRTILIILKLLAQRKLPNLVKSRLCSKAAGASQEVCHEVVTKIIDLYEGTDSWSPMRYSEILIACYKFSLIEDAEKLLDRYGSIIVSETVIDHLLDMMNNHSVHNSTDKSDPAAIEKMKKSLVTHFVKVMSNLESRQNAVICKDRDARLLGLEKCGISVTQNVNIKYGGKCTNCNHQVPILEKQIAPKIHAAIKSKCFDQQSFLNKTSTPQEVRRFEEFLDNLYKRDRKPLDLVIDGLNIAFNKSYSYKIDDTVQSENLKKVVRNFDSDILSQKLVNTIIRSDVLNNYRRVLLIGRFSMKYWPGLTFFLNKHNVDVFFLDTKSNDDLFTLYAATKYHKTLFMSNDLMRQHIPILFPDNEEDKKDMSLWLETHQIMVTPQLMALRPKPYGRIPSVLPEQRIMHLPIFDYDKYCEFASRGTVQELPGSVFTWLCCRY